MSADMADGWGEFAEIYKKYIDFNHGTNVENILAFRIVKDFYEDSKKIADGLKNNLEAKIIFQHILRYF